MNDGFPCLQTNKSDADRNAANRFMERMRFSIGEVDRRNPCFIAVLELGPSLWKGYGPGSIASNEKSRRGGTPAKEFRPVGLHCHYDQPPPDGGCCSFSHPYLNHTAFVTKYKTDYRLSIRMAGFICFDSAIRTRPTTAKNTASPPALRLGLLGPVHVDVR